MSRAVARGKLAGEDRQQLLARVRFTAALDDLGAAQLVVEAVPERLDLKREIFGRLYTVVDPAAILATNTSSLSIAEIAASTREPGRVVGLHFFNPAPVQRLVEVVRTVVTEPSSSRTPSPSRGGWASSRSSSATEPGSSRMRCCSATSTTPCGCTSRATSAARTSTPR